MNPRAMNPGAQPTVEPALAAHIDDLLDEALKGTFPASDPVAIGVTSQDDQAAPLKSTAAPEG